MRPFQNLFWLVLIQCIASVQLSAQNMFIFQDSDKNPQIIARNPALIRLGEHESAVGIFFIEGNVMSNTGSISSGDLLHINANFLRQNVLGTSKISTGAGLLDIHGPSFAYGINSRLTLAVNTRTRLHSNYWNADGRLISEIGEIVKVPQEYPYVMDRERMLMVASAFSEIGLSASYNAYQTDNSKLNVGITLNLINGAANTSISVPYLSGTVKRINSYLTSLSDATGQVSTQTSGNFFGDASLRNLVRPRQASVSTTIGAVYEYRRSKNEPCVFRLGISVNDIGNVRFKADSAYSKNYNIDIPANKGLFFNNNFNNSAFSQTTRVFDKYPEFFERTKTSSGRYTVGLPATFQWLLDVRLAEKFFLGSNATLSLKRKNDIGTLRNNSGFSIAPRWEHRQWGIAVALSYQEYAGLNSGINIKAGPFFISGSTLLSGTFGSAKQLNFSTGLILPSPLLR